MDDLIRLYPTPAVTVPLRGAYLAHNLRQVTEKTGKPFIFASFVASLDGRIAIARSSDSNLIIPKSVANQRDWRLFQELAAQADIILSSGRYLRDWANGHAQEILQTNDPRFADLRVWREKQGLPAQPDIAFISGSLDFSIPQLLSNSERKVVIFTISNANPERIKELQSQSIKVIIAGERSIDGVLLQKALMELGHRTIFSASGPKILHLLLQGRVLDRLYLAQTNRLLAGQIFSTILEGPLFDPPTYLKINQIYLDPDGLDGLGQLFVSYDRM